MTQSAIPGSDARRASWPNLLWPTARRRRAGVVGEIGRVMHWTGVIAAALCGLLALEFLVEGWATRLSMSLLATAAVLVLAARGLRWLLARE
ncbi:hypothetical protein [Phenylobacterium sp.]|jgi:hypothetical protein|uniref:hypothetical protein n=1 Tax=Phenylobacterium sp. TaxID=1871053 RepID=UPI002F412ADC